MEIKDEKDIVCDTNVEEPIIFNEEPTQEKNLDCSQKKDDIIMHVEKPSTLDESPIQEKDNLNRANDSVDIQKPQALKETVITEEKRDDSSICTSVSATKKEEKVEERDNLNHEKNREVVNEQPIRCDISTTTDEDFHPPVKFIYIPIIHIDTHITNQPKPTLKLGLTPRKPSSSRVRSKSANDKKIMDILKKGREKFLKRRASSARLSSTE